MLRLLDSGWRNYLRRVPNDCVLYYPGLNITEKSSSATVEDYSGQDNDGTSAQVTQVQLESGLWVFYLDQATGSKIDVTGLTTDLSTTGDFTVEIWAKADTTIRYVMCQSHTVDPYASDWILGASADVALFWIRSETVNEPAGFDDTVWNHIAMAWDKSEETYEGFVNGVSAGTSAVVAGYGGTASVKIGANGAGTANYTGYLALPRIVTRKMNAIELATHYQKEYLLFKE